MSESDEPSSIAYDDLKEFCAAILAKAGADDKTVKGTCRAILHGSLLGIDSHGVRLLSHYVRVLQGGRVNPRPEFTFSQNSLAACTLDAGHGHGAPATYAAMEKAITLARQSGLAAVAIKNSSHFGPAGAFALEAAKAGMIGIAVCNTNSAVRLHEGADAFHGTNPIAIGAPVEQGDPWLFDMATSAIPLNRVFLYRSLGLELPVGVASDDGGNDTQSPEDVRMLAPLGGEFGFKGAGLAGLAEILSAALTGMKLSFEIAAMGQEPYDQPREMGAFVLAIDPGAFLPKVIYFETMNRYLAALRNSKAVAGGQVMAPGDREWRERERRLREGIPLDAETFTEFAQLSTSLNVPLSGPRRN